MKIKKLKGVVAAFIAGILLLAIGIVLFLGLNTLDTPQEMYNKGIVYNENTAKEDKRVAVKLVSISQPETSDNTLIYFALVEGSSKVVAIEVNKDSQTHQAINEWIASPDEYTYIIAKIDKFNSQTSAELAQTNTTSVIPINTQIYLSASDYENDVFGMRIATFGLIVFGSGLLVLGVFNWRRNKKTYAELIALYPELANKKQVANQADFIGKKSKLVVYKKHLLILNAGVRKIDLEQVKWLDIREVPAYRTTMVELKIVNLSDELKTFNLGNYRKKAAAEYDALMDYISEHFPNILLGEEYQPENVKTKGLFKIKPKQSLDEFLAEHQTDEVKDDTQTITEKVSEASLDEADESVDVDNS